MRQGITIAVRPNGDVELLTPKLGDLDSQKRAIKVARDKHGKGDVQMTVVLVSKRHAYMSRGVALPTAKAAKKAAKVAKVPLTDEQKAAKKTAAAAKRKAKAAAKKSAKAAAKKK